jgi:hypothetical protein
MLLQSGYWIRERPQGPIEDWCFAVVALIDPGKYRSLSYILSGQSGFADRPLFSFFQS